jgi:hypothetical protein
MNQNALFDAWVREVSTDPLAQPVLSWHRMDEDNPYPLDVNEALEWVEAFVHRHIITAHKDARLFRDMWGIWGMREGMGRFHTEWITTLLRTEIKCSFAKTRGTWPPEVLELTPMICLHPEDPIPWFLLSEHERLAYIASPKH